MASNGTYVPTSFTRRKGGSGRARPNEKAKIRNGERGRRTLSTHARVLQRQPDAPLQQLLDMLLREGHQDTSCERFHHLGPIVYLNPCSQLLLRAFTVWAHVGKVTCSMSWFWACCITGFGRWGILWNTTKLSTCCSETLPMLWERTQASMSRARDIWGRAKSQSTSNHPLPGMAVSLAAEITRTPQLSPHQSLIRYGSGQELMALSFGAACEIAVMWQWAANTQALRQEISNHACADKPGRKELQGELSLFR